MVTTYDRADLIEHAIHTLKHELLIEMIIVSLVILLFLWHIPSAVVPILTIPISVLLTFIPLYYFGITVNIMSLAGIAISIGVLVDGAIVEVENAYNKLHEWQAGGRKGDYHKVRLEALQEIGPSVFFSLLVIAVAFIPIFVLVDQEGRLFKPLAWSKNLTMALAAVSGHHAGSGPADDVHAHGSLSVQAEIPGQAGLRGARRHLPCRRTPSDQPHDLSGLRAGLPLRAAPPAHGDRRGVPAGGSEHSRLLQAGVGVHAAAQRGHDSLHADHAARHLGGAGPGSHGDAGSGAQVLPRSGAGIRQGRACRHLHRPRAALHDGDHGRPEADRRVAFEEALVLVLAARLAQTPGPADLVGSHLMGRAGNRDGSGVADPGRHQRLDDADQGPHRHAHHRCAHASRHQDLRLGSQGDRGIGRPHRGHGPRYPRHAQRVRRARDRGLLRRYRAAPRSACSLRAQDRRRADGGHECDWRGERVDLDRGARAVLDQRALPPRAAGRHRPPAARAHRNPHRRAGPAGAGGRPESRERAGHDSR